jgi:hypothetical protein
MGRDQSAGIGVLAKPAPGSAGGIAREMKSNRRSLLGDSSRALPIIRPTAAEQFLRLGAKSFQIG